MREGGKEERRQGRRREERYVTEAGKGKKEGRRSRGEIGKER